MTCLRQPSSSRDLDAISSALGWRRHVVSWKRRLRQPSEPRDLAPPPPRRSLGPPPPDTAPRRLLPAPLCDHRSLARRPARGSASKETEHTVLTVRSNAAMLSLIPSLLMGAAKAADASLEPQNAPLPSMNSTADALSLYMLPGSGNCIEFRFATGQFVRAPTYGYSDHTLTFPSTGGVGFDWTVNGRKAFAYARGFTVCPGGGALRGSVILSVRADHTSSYILGGISPSVSPVGSYITSSGAYVPTGDLQDEVVNDNAVNTGYYSGAMVKVESQDCVSFKVFNSAKSITMKLRVSAFWFNSNAGC